MAQNPLISAFSIVGCLTSLFVFLSPILTFKKIYTNKSIGQPDSLPFVVTFSSTVLWIYYGVLNDYNVPILVTNSIGWLLELVYIIMYIYYATYESRIRTFKQLAVSVVALPLSIILTLCLVSHYYRVGVVGWVSTASSLLVFISPICDIARVVKTRDFRHMSFWLSLALTWSGAAWMAYGLVKRDFSVAVSNAVGVVLGLGQMLVYVVIRANHPQA